MQADAPANGLWRSVTAYYAPHVDGSDFKGLPLPFGHLIVPQDGESDGHRLGVVPKTSVITVSGEWRVVQETDKGGYPVTLVREARDAAVAATLSTYGDNQRYWNALIGYDAAVGTFGIAEIRSYQPDGWVETIAHPEPENPVTYHFQNPESEQPFLWEVSPEGRGLQSRYVCCLLEGHRPWDVLKRCQLGGFNQLRDRYEKAATTIGRRFNPVPPGQRRPLGDDVHRDPEKARELHEIAKEFCSDETTEWEHERQ